jgi:outer membrane protein assembly factor BamB
MLRMRRRQLLSQMGCGIAMAGLSGCSLNERHSNDSLAKPVDGNWKQKFGGLKNNPNLSQCPRPQLDVIWRKKLEGEWINTPPLVCKNKIFIGTAEGTVLCFKARSGRAIWRRGNFSGVQAAFGIHNETVVVPSDDGNLHGVKTNNGQTLWSTSISGPAVNPITITNDTALVASLHGYLYAIDIGSGNVNWKRNLGNRTVAKPAVRNDVVILPVVDSSHTLHALDVNDGTSVWEKKFEKNISETVRIFDGFAYALGNRNDIIDSSSGRRGAIFKLDANTGQIIRSSSFNSTHFGNSNCGVRSLVVSDEGMYATACDVIASYDKNGHENWQLQVENGIATELVLCRDGLMFADYDGILYLVSQSGTITPLTQKTNSHPPTPCIIDDTVIFCANRSVTVLK